ncbi:hypothetical protein ACG00X_23600 [Roseateles sp. BYS96W]|uniref:Uncharacterized protein n=2 Tax=Pelomonas nitida TaxID=3299027 RepID=A0ABW7GD19_9BURK
MASVRQAKAKRESMTARADRLLQHHFPDYCDDWLWTRQKHDGYTTVPRTLPLVMQAVDANSKGQPAGHTLFCLWARSPDNPLLVIENPGTFAAEAGFTGERAVDTWRRRMKKLKELHLIDVEEGETHDFNYVLLLNPNVAMEHMYQRGWVSKRLFSRFENRAAEVGAFSEIEAIRKHWTSLREEDAKAAEPPKKGGRSGRKAADEVPVRERQPPIPAPEPQPVAKPRSQAKPNPEAT